MAEMGKTGLQVKRHWIINLGPDAAFMEVLFQGIAFAGADDELVVDMPSIGRFERDGDSPVESGTVEQLAVAGRVRAASLSPCGKMWRLHPQHGRLNGVHPKIAADEVVVVLRFHAVGPQQTRALRQRVVVGRQQPGVAKRA